jgi:hypothetical protein
MDMKIWILICFFYIHIGGKEKEWDSYKMEIVIKKGEK